MLSRVSKSVRQTPRMASSVRSFFGASAPEQNDLTEEFPGTPSGTPSLAGSNDVTVSVLKNGLRVASAPGSGGATSVGVVVDMGSRHEPAGVEGGAHLLKNSIFKENSERSHLRVIRDLENIGATCQTSTGREISTYSVDCLKGDVATAVEILGDAVLTPRFESYDITEYKAAAKVDAASSNASAEYILGEALHAAAFYDDSPLGRPVLTEASCGADELKGFFSSRTVGGNMVLSAVGVEHSDLVALAESHFGSVVEGTAAASGASPYVGGEYRVSGTSAHTHVAIGFGHGGYDDSHSVAIDVLRASLGAVSTSYRGAGLFALAGAADADYAGDLVKSLVGSLKAAASTPLSDEALAAAKASVSSNTAFGNECRGVLMENIGTQLLVNGKYESSDASKLEAVSAADVQAAAKSLLSTPPSLASVGDVSSVPRVADVKAML